MPDLPLPNGDLMIHAEQRSWVETSLTALASFEPPKEAASVEADDESFWGPEYAFARPYRVRDGDLIIPVQGVLMHGFPWQFGKWATGYDYIVAAVKRGVSDPDVKRVVLHVNSPGGVVSGAFDASDAIFNMRGEKPIIAVADEHAYSAGYAIASAADEIVVARTGGVGSVGVIAAHIETSKLAERAGVTVTLIYAGDRKADGHPSQPLSDEARKRMQDRVNNSYQIFVSTVARNRGLDEASVRDTEADSFGSREAVENGLADRVGNLGSLSANAENSLEQEDDTMSKDTTAVDQAAHTAAVDAARTEGLEAGKAEGMALGATAERERIQTIMDSDEAKSRPAAARQVAMHTDMSAEAAASFLAGLPEEAKAAPKETASAPKGGNAFENAMNATGNPNLGAGVGDNANDEAKGPQAVADSIFASAGFPAQQ